MSSIKTESLSRLKPVPVSEFERNRFFRQANWRIVRAENLLNGVSKCRNLKQEDPIVVEAVKYLRTRRRLFNKGYDSYAVDRRLMSAYPDMFYAMEWHEAGSHAVPTISLQAHLLTELNYVQIAERIGTDPVTVSLYSSLFYDVTDRLNSIEYIAGHVIGPVFQAGIEALNPELMAKYFAYFGGYSMLNQVLYGMSRSTGEKSDEEVTGHLQTAISRNFKYQTAVTAILMRPSRYDIKTMIEGYLALVNMEQGDIASDKEQYWVAELTDLLSKMNPVPRTIPEREAFLLRTNSVRHDTVIEPRASERMQLSKRELSVEEMRSQLNDFTLPNEAGLQNTETRDRK